MSITRYPGIASFEDSEVGSRLFFGREEDSKLLLFSILSEYITVLFSKSGYGKTSLLQADVFKKLRERGFYPIQVRFNNREFLPRQIIIAEVKNLSAKDKVNEIIVPPDEGNLKDFFSNLSIWSPDDKLLTPVLIFDQFEEIFLLKHNAAGQVSFFEELAAVTNACRDGELSLKMVFSIREDFLGHLENLSIKIPSIFTNRFRLEALTTENAEKAITIPAAIEMEGVSFESPPFYFSGNALKEMLHFLSLEVVEGKWEQTDHVEPVQLQIICSELEKRVISGQIKKRGDGQIIVSSGDLGGDAGLRAILGRFYDKQLERITAELTLEEREVLAIRNLVELDLISGKRRVPMDYDSIIRKAGIRKEALDLLIKSKLLKEVTYESSSLVEISHDSLIEPVLESYEERKKKEILAIEARRLREKRNKIIGATIVVTLIIGLCLGIYALMQHKEAVAQANRADKAEDSLRIAEGMLDSVSRSYRIRVDSLIQEHVRFVPADTAFVYRVIPAPPAPVKPSLPDTKSPPELDTVAYQNIFFDPNSSFISISGDGSKIITADRSGHSHLYDITGKLKETLSEPGPLTSFDFAVAGIALIGSGNGILNLWDKNNRWSGNLANQGAPVTMAVFSPQFGSPRYMKYILFCTADGRAGLLDLFGRTVKKLGTGERITTAAFSADGKKILTGSSDGVARIWKINEDRPVDSFVNRSDGRITAIALSPDEKRLVTGSANGQATVWDMGTKIPVVTIANNRKVSGLAFKKQADKLYIGYADGSIKLFGIQYNGKEYTSVATLREYRGHSGPIQSMYFRESDNKLFTTSADGSAKIWADK